MMASYVKVTTSRTQGLTLAVILTVFCNGIQCATLSTDGSTSTVKAGIDNLDLKCTITFATNETGTSLKWSKSGTTIVTYTFSGTPSSTSPWTVPASNSNSLTARLPGGSVTKTHAGSYKCEVVTSAGSTPVSKTFTVTVQYKPEVTISGTPNRIENEVLTLTCNGAAVPSSTTYTWKKRSTTRSSSKTLTIRNIKRSDAGSYTCTATNTVGSTSKTQSVNVYYVDTPVMNSRFIEVKESQNASMRCTVTSNPTADLTIVGPHQSQSATGSSSLDFSFSARCQDTGDYRCSAKNSKITSPRQTNFNVSVLCSPRKDVTVAEETEFVRNLTQSAVIKGTVVAHPQPVFKWKRQVLDTNVTIDIQHDPGHFEITNTAKTSRLKVTLQNADDFAKYIMEAENNEGTTSMEYFLRTHTKPYQVTVLEKENVTTDSVAVRWVSSFNGGARQHYIIQYQPMTDGSYGVWTQKTAQITDPGRNQYVYARISDIHPDRTYRVRVFSENTFGQSPYSDEIQITTAGVLPFGVGIVIGLVISVVLVAAVIGGIIVYKKKIQPMREKRAQSNHTDQDNNYQTSATGLYDGLEGTRERPTTYDDLKADNNVYQNVNMNNKEAAVTVQSPEKVYVNFSQQKSVSEQTHKQEKKRKEDKKRAKKNKHKLKQNSGLQQYENTVINEPPAVHDNNNEMTYANT